MLAGSFNSVFRHVLSQPEESLGTFVAIYRFVGEDGFWMEFRCVASLLDVDGPIFMRNGYDATELLAADASELAVGPKIGILKDKAVPMDGRLRRTPGFFFERKPRETGTFVEEILGGKIT